MTRWKGLVADRLVPAAAIAVVAFAGLATGATGAGAAVIHTKPAAARAETGAVSVAVRAEAAGGARTAYAVRVRNDGPQADLTVALQMPAGVRLLKATDEGRAVGDTVVWRLSLPVSGERELRGTTSTGAATPLSTACVSDATTARVLDCAAVRDAAAADGSGGTWPWRTIATYAAIAVLAVGAIWFARRLWRRRPVRPAVRRVSTRENRGPYVWMVLLLALLALALPVAAAIALLGPRVTEAGRRDPGGSGVAAIDHGGWTGQHLELERGVPASDGTVEFTVYRMDCSGTAALWCRAIVAARNVSESPQLWAPQSQRLYLTTGAWVTVNAPITASANGGFDMFVEPIGPGQRLVATLVFTVPAGAQPTRLELREGVFARGVYLRLR